MILDLSFLGRDTARDPIVVKSASRIEQDARRKGRAWYSVAALFAALFAIVRRH
jgi:hypothetical protein